MYKILVLLLLVSSIVVFAQDVVINEVMSSNKVSLLDEDGDASDWIEVYNKGAQQINLLAYGLSDDTLNTHKWQFSNTIIQPGGHLIIFASGKDRDTLILHTNFKISASGEKIMLSDSSGAVIDFIDVPLSAIDIAYGRTNDGELPWLFLEPTPGGSNNGAIVKSFADSISVSHSAGFYPSQISVTLSAGTSKIYYTLDGSIPDSTKMLYTVPIVITKTTVLKAVSVKAGYVPTHPITRTYFINESTDLPVISLSADPYDLFDSLSGIYKNFTMDWERPAHVEFFEDNKTPGFSEDCGINIHGAQSANWDQKSFNVKFKSAYGISKLEYPLFPGFRVTKFNSFVLRNSGNDWQYTHIRDAMQQYLVKDLDIDYTEYRPATTFINGQYWGIYNIREKVSEHYIGYRHNVDPDNIDMLESNMMVLHGDSLDYQEILDYMSSKNMSSDSAHEFLNSRIDMNECILYFAAQAYYDNLDWPGPNIIYWRDRNAAGKWRWILYDLDFGFGLYAHNASEDHIQFMFSPVETRYSNPPWATFFQRKLIENPKIKNQFINQIADLLNTNFKSERVNDMIDALANHIANELPKHRARWKLTGENLTKMKTFGQDRPAYLRTHVRNYFKCGSDGNITVNVLKGGKVKLNSLTIDSTAPQFSGIYFQKNQIYLKAIPDPGYKFDGWSGDTVTQNPALSMFVKANTELFAFFSKDTNTTSGIVINEINYNSSKSFDAGDWVELYNGSDKIIDVSKWVFSDSDTSHRFIIPDGMIVEPHQYLVLVEDDSAFTSRFPNVSNYLGEIGFGLDGSGELIRLMDSDGQIIDSLTYDDQAPWPVEPDGTGPTLELLNASSDNSLGESWKASKEHGSPGKINTIITSVEKNKNNNLPEKFFLFQNYPNPFNPTTNIRYSLPVSSVVNLKVMDILGREVIELVNKRQEAGVYDVAFDASKLSSGIYFYRLQTNSFAATKKCIVLK